MIKRVLIASILNNFTRCDRTCQIILNINPGFLKRLKTRIREEIYGGKVFKY